MIPPYFRLPCLLAALVTGCSWSFSARASVADSRETDLFHELKSLSPQETSYSRVKSLVLALTRENPTRTSQFFKLGERKLLAEDPLNSKLPNLAQVVGKVVGRSGLSVETRKQIQAQIERAIEGPHFVLGMPRTSNSGLTVTTSGVTITLDGTNSDSRTVSGTFTSVGAVSGTITFAATGEGLTGEAPINVLVPYTAAVFSGNALFNGSKNGSWAPAANWGDLDVYDLGGPGTPGLDGVVSFSDTATFGNGSEAGAASIVTLDGVSPTLAGLTFNTSASSYTIAPGTGGGIMLTGKATPIEVSSSEATIAVPLTGGGGLNKSGPGRLLLTGVSTFTGATLVTGGTLRLAALGGRSALAATSGVTIGPGATLLLGAPNQINDAASLTLAGGTFDTNGMDETLGALSLTSESVIDLGDGATILRFAGSSSSDWTGDLSIWDYDGTPITDGGTDAVFFGLNANGLTVSQLAEIHFYTGAGTGTEYDAQLLGNGELVAVLESGASTTAGFSARFLGDGQVTAVPESRAVVPGILGLLGVAVLRHRRRKIFEPQKARRTRRF